MFTKPYMDWKYERISGAEAVGGAVKDAAIEGATAVAGGATLKVAGKAAKPVIKAGASKLSGVLSKSKSDWMARFGENLKDTLSSQKNFTKAEMKEILSSKANDNAFLMNDNNVHMSRSKVVGGDNFDVGTVSSNIGGGVPGSRVSVKPYNSQTAMGKKIDVLKKKKCRIKGP